MGGLADAIGKKQNMENEGGNIELQAIMCIVDFRHIAGPWAGSAMNVVTAMGRTTPLKALSLAGPWVGTSV